MFRDLSDDLINALLPLVREIASDRELQPEIRDHSLTIYYRGAALIRELKIENENLVGCAGPQKLDRLLSLKSNLYERFLKG